MSTDLENWLATIGLEKYVELFSRNEVDFQVLPLLSEDDLKELGLPLGARRKLQAAVLKLSEESTRPARKSQRELAAKGEAERRQLTVMFCDLMDSTEASKVLDPEDLREVNRAYQDECASAIESCGGYVARYMGDGVLAYFGYPQAHEDDAERAIHAGLSIVESMAKLNKRFGDNPGFTLKVRVGITTGPVVVGDIIGEGASQESAVVGETPNIAARLQSLADANSVVVGPTTHDLAGGIFEYEELGARQIKGIGNVRIWRIVSPSLVESRFEARRGTRVTPLVGRGHEVGLLIERWAHAKEGDGQVALLCGEPGIGKSRIIEILRERTAQDDPAVLLYQCSAYHKNSALYPLIEQLIRITGIERNDSSELSLKKLESFVLGATQNVASVLPLFADLLSIPSEGKYPPMDMSSEQQKLALFKALISYILGLSENRPLLLIFEDVHWADPTSLELLESIVSRAQDSSMLVVITFRPEFLPPWGDYSHITSLKLGRFSRKQVITMIDQVSGGKRFPEAVYNHIIEKTDGVPLFIEELTKAVIESGALQDEGNRYALRGPLTALAIPSTLHDSLMARLDRLASIREVAQIAAVIGREFSQELLAAVSNLASKELEDALNQLRSAGLVFPAGSESDTPYIFKHALVQDAAYESLLKAKRRDLHAQIADVIEKNYPEKKQSEPELLAHHYTNAGLVDPALKYWLRAGKRSIERCAHSEAIAHLERGLSIIDSLPEGKARNTAEIDFRVALGVPLIGKEGAASAIVAKNYQRARSLCEATETNAPLYPILWGLWLHYFFGSKLQQASSLADQLLKFGQKNNHVEQQLEAHHCQWAVQFVRGDLKAALDHCDVGMQLYQAEVHHELSFTYGGHDPGVCARNVSGIALWLLGYPEQSKDRFDSAFSLARKLGHSATIADALQMVVEVTSLERDESVLKVQAEELLEFAEAERMFDNQTLANGLLGWVRFRQGEAREGLGLMRESVNQWLSKGIAWTAIPITLIAEAYAQNGDIEEGLRVVEEAITLGERDDVRWWEAELYRVKGELLHQYAPGAPKGAEDSLMKAIRIARIQDTKLLELRASNSLAEIWRTQGKEEQIRDLISPVYNWFTEGFNTADLRQAKTFLEDPI